MWDQPAKVMTTAERNAISADGAPPGVYVSNMSEDDRQRWRAKLIGQSVGHPSVEIRKTAGAAQVVIVVTLGGFREKGVIRSDGFMIRQRHHNIKISQGGAASYSWEDWEDMKQAIEEARQILEAL